MKIHAKWTVLMTFLSLILLSGCMQEELPDTEMNEGDKAVLSLMTRVGGTGTAESDEERIVNTLRLMVFNQSGVLAYNKLYTDVNNILKEKDGIFYIRERLPKTLENIKICLIANECLSWDLNDGKNEYGGVLTYTQLKDKYIDFSRDYDHFFSESMDNMDIYQGNGNFVMFAEASTPFGQGGETVDVPLALVRMVAKVTMSLSFDLTAISGVNYEAGDRLVLNYASIINQPLESYLTPKTYQLEESIFLSTSTKQLNTVKEASTAYTTQPVTFYIPEHLLSEVSFGEKDYTYIQIVGTYISAGGVDMLVSYKVPLGNGVQKIFSNASYTPVAKDYNIERNHHYIVNGKITKLGEFDGLELKLSIVDWGKGEDIEVERPAPYLNVSEIDWGVGLAADDAIFVDAVRTDNVFFWTNQPNESIRIEEVEWNVYKADGQLVADLMDVYPDAPVSCMLYKYTAGGDYFFENNGYVKLDFSLPGFDMIDHRIECSFKICAGSLKRRVKVVYSIM